MVEAELRDVQLLVEQEDDDVHRAEARAEVAGARALDGGERVEPAHVGDEREVRSRARANSDFGMRLRSLKTRGGAR